MSKEKDPCFYDVERNYSSNRGMKMTFCATCKNCPSINIHKDLDKVILGGDEEGFSVWSKEQFIEFAKEIKKGTFDGYIK